MFRTVRRTTMRVRDGRVQRKNRTSKSPHIFQDTASIVLIERERPGSGYRHVVRRQDVRRFLSILPQWNDLSRGLTTIVLGRGERSMGWYDRGVVAICAWEKEIEWDDCCPMFFREHRALFDKLAVRYEVSQQAIRVHFTAATARAFQLVHVLVHELGHHHDRMTSASKRAAARGETYAEQYARQFEDEIISRYRREFKL
jgi:hypothetical protein